MDEKMTLCMSCMHNEVCAIRDTMDDDDERALSFCYHRKEFTDRWISVEERLPTPYQNVIVWRDNYLDNGGCVDIDFTFTFNDGDVEWADHMRTWKSVVTHWMPLPEPPKEEEL